MYGATFSHASPSFSWAWDQKKNLLFKLLCSLPYRPEPPKWLVKLDDQVSSRHTQHTTTSPLVCVINQTSITFWSFLFSISSTGGIQDSLPMRQLWCLSMFEMLMERSMTVSLLKRTDNKLCKQRLMLLSILIMN